ncbi:hypothetical protein [Chryseobacterium sp. HR92]|uniref:hypothetical protein n=1 Tax=Chryseobacterium sp. HR92 TaxID=3094839 RepID=UPI00388EA426|nr:hypothetical protein SFA27_15590 [Chryseobacterium sp. HR92]
MISKEEAHRLQKLTPFNTTVNTAAASTLSEKKSICRNAIGRQLLNVFILDDFDNEVVYSKMIL